MSDDLFIFGPSQDDEIDDQYGLSDDDLIFGGLSPYGPNQDRIVLQLAPAETVMGAVDAAPFGGGMVPVTPLESVLVRGVNTPEIAARVQQALLRIYPPDISVTLVNEDNDSGEDTLEFPLSELAKRQIGDDEILVLPPVDPYERTRVIEGLQQIIASLRAPGGCPWDREQTHQSLTRYMIEEAYEAVQAIETGGPSKLAEELGDVLLQILLHAQIAEEQGTFMLEDVFEILASKMIRRHPHVFGDRSAETAEEVVTAWDQIKQQERSGQPDEDAPSIFDSVPPSLPALARTQALLRRAESRGIDCEQISVRVLTALSESDNANESRFAGQLAALARDARAQGIDAEGALRRWTECFEKIANEAVTETK